MSRMKWIDAQALLSERGFWGYSGEWEGQYLTWYRSLAAICTETIMCLGHPFTNCDDVYYKPSQPASSASLFTLSHPYKTHYNSARTLARQTAFAQTSYAPEQ